MTFLKAPRDAILRPLQTVAGIVDRRHALPILANVLLRKEGDRVVFLASDVEIQIQTHAQVGGDGADEAVTVSARKLLDILRSLPDVPDGQVSVSLSNRRATLSGGRSRFALQTMPAADFPDVKRAEEWRASFRLPQKTLRHLFQMVHFAMAQQDIRFYLNGLLFATEPGLVKVVATDGHRLAYCEAKVDAADLPRHEVIVPRKTVIELQRLLSDSEEPVAIDIADKQIQIRFGDIEMLSKLIEGKFPDYRRVIPEGYENVLSVDRQALAGSLTRASILTTEKFKGIRMTLSDEGLSLQTSNSEQEEAVEELEADYRGDPIDIGFNVAYLLDALANLKCDEVHLNFGDSGSSALLTAPSETGFKYVVMPMRI